MIFDSYRPVLAQRSLRRVLPAMALSGIGDGMTMVAVPWLAIHLAAPGQRGLVTGLAVAAYTMPGILLAVLLTRRFKTYDARRLILLEAVLRGVSLGAVPFLHLTPVTYVACVAVSSLLLPWGAAGRSSLIAELLPAEHRRAGNSLVGAMDFAAFVIGPGLGGLAITYLGAQWVLGLDGLTWLLLALSVYGLPSREVPTAERTDGVWRFLRADRDLLTLLALTFVFYFLYGPVEVALPVHVAEDLGGRPGVLGLFWMLLSVGGLVGGLVAGALRKLPLWPAAIGIAFCWGLSLLPLGLPFVGLIPALVAFTIGGLAYGPYPPLARTLVQNSTPPELLTRVFALWGSIVNLAPPLGTLAGTPLVATAGPRATLLASAALTMVFAALAGVLVFSRKGPSSSA